MAETIMPLADVLRAARVPEEAGRWGEALAIYQRALDRWRPVGAAPTCDLLRRIGLVHYHRGDLEVALGYFETSREQAAAAGLQEQIAGATNCLGIVRQAQGQLDAAVSLFRSARTMAEQAGSVRLAVMIDQNLGIIASIRGDTGEALRRYESALERYRALGDGRSAARVLNNIGMVHCDVGRWQAAEIAFTAALAQAEAAGDVETLATVQLNRAELYLAVDRFDDARACCDQAFEIFARLESKSGLGETYKAYGVLYRESGKLHLAEAHLALVAELARAADHPLLEAEAEAEYALVHLAQGRSQLALQSLNRAHRLFGDLKARREVVDVESQLDALEQRYLQVVQVWGESLESKDLYTAGHCARVADHAARLAEAYGFRGRELTWIRMGAFLHDVGKTAVAATVLTKPAGLDPREQEEMRRHTVAGDEIVAELEFPWDIRPMVRSHHERWDGRGYPDQLKGEEIPVIARILCIADVFDALTTDRSYRPAFPVDEALAIMRVESGGTFDPSLLELFLAVMSAEPQVEPSSAGTPRPS